MTRGELVLVLTGSVFLVVWMYCLLMTMLLVLIHRSRIKRVSFRITPLEIAVGEQARIVYSESDEIAHNIDLFQLPGILIRCRVLLYTKDGRRIRHDFRPGTSAFTVKKRGAYFSDYDEFAVFDMFGFFRIACRLPQMSDARLLAAPAAGEPVPANARAGESAQRPEFTFQRTDNLIEHRPYMPGDDPRRINWKLFGHGGELFVREGEQEPPPRSNMLILVDTQFDPLLYSAAAARRGVDVLCENALAAALACAESGFDVRVGYSSPQSRLSAAGGQCDNRNETIRRGNSPMELAAAFARPAALPLSAAAELPSPTEDRGILILALPRAAAENSALDRFLRSHAGRAAGRETAPTVELVFLYGVDAITGYAAAKTCAAIYNRRPGVRAFALGH
jgi:uncharacterized protein (DUF58 family)